MCFTSRYNTIEIALCHFSLQNVLPVDRKRRSSEIMLWGVIKFLATWLYPSTSGYRRTIHWKVKGKWQIILVTRSLLNQNSMGIRECNLHTRYAHRRKVQVYPDIHGMLFLLYFSPGKVGTNAARHLLIQPWILTLRWTKAVWNGVCLTHYSTMNTENQTQIFWSWVPKPHPLDNMLPIRSLLVIFFKQCMKKSFVVLKFVIGKFHCSTPHKKSLSTR